MSYKLEEITLEDMENREIYEFLKDSSDYFLLYVGEEPTVETLREIITEVPEGWNQDDKVVLRAVREGSTVGLIDILKNYPKRGRWMIGLLLLRPEERGLGMGRKLHEDIKKMALEGGIEALRVGVLEDNPNALKFWSKLGYRSVKKTKVNIEGRDRVIEVMTLDIKDL